MEGRRAGGLVAGRRKPRGMGRPRERGNGSAQGGRGAELGLLAARERERGGEVWALRPGTVGKVVFLFLFFCLFFLLFKSLFKLI